MALTLTGYVLSVNLMDNAGDISTKRYHLRGIDYAAAIIDTAAVLSAIAGVTDSEVASYSVNAVFDEGVLTYPAVNVDNKTKASLTCVLDGVGAKKANIRIPAPKIDIFTATSGAGANVVDMSDIALVAYGDLFKSTGQCFISDGENLLNVSSGRRV